MAALPGGQQRRDGGGGQSRGRGRLRATTTRIRGLPGCGGALQAHRHGADRRSAVHRRRLRLELYLQRRRHHPELDRHLRRQDPGPQRRRQVRYRPRHPPEPEVAPSPGDRRPALGPDSGARHRRALPHLAQAAVRLVAVRHRLYRASGPHAGGGGQPPGSGGGPAGPDLRSRWRDLRGALHHRPKEELGLELVQHLHNVVWHRQGGQLYLVCQAWNPGFYFVLGQV